MNVGFIGVGNMGEALLKGFINKNVVKPDNIFIFDVDKEKSANLSKDIKVKISEDEIECVEKCDLIILAVKPNIYDIVLEKIKNHINDKIILTIAAGYEISRVESIIGDNKKIIRTMPNTPLMVYEGATVISSNNVITKNEVDDVTSMFSNLGEVYRVEEEMIDLATGISGSGPAYVYMFIDSLAKGGIKNGLPKELAYNLAIQTVLGASKMVKETGEEPNTLKEKVCSPGGTTIEAVKSLEKDNFEQVIINAVDACIEKSKKMK